MALTILGFKPRMSIPWNTCNAASRLPLWYSNRPNNARASCSNKPARSQLKEQYPKGLLPNGNYLIVQWECLPQCWFYVIYLVVIKFRLAVSSSWRQAADREIPCGKRFRGLRHLFEMELLLSWASTQHVDRFPMNLTQWPCATNLSLKSHRIVTLLFKSSQVSKGIALLLLLLVMQFCHHLDFFHKACDEKMSGPKWIFNHYHWYNQKKYFKNDTDNWIFSKMTQYC